MNIYCLKGIYLLLISILSVSIAQAAAISDTLAGEIVHAETGEPIPGATILLEKKDMGTAADSNGRFEISNLAAGTYRLKVRSVGFKTSTISIDHPGTGFILIELEPDIYHGDDIIVTSSPIGRTIQYQPASAFNAEMLQQKAAPSLGEILDGTPGVTTRSYGSAPARPVIRGFDGDRVLVMQNGERMGDLSGTAVDHAGYGHKQSKLRERTWISLWPSRNRAGIFGNELYVRPAGGNR